MPSSKLRQSALLILLLTACQKPQAPVIYPTPDVTPTPAPTINPSQTLTPTPTPPPVNPNLQNPPNLQTLTEADIVGKKETARIDEGWLSPDGSKLIYQLHRTRSVGLKNSPTYPSARQTSAEVWLLNHSTGLHIRLSNFNPEGLYPGRLQWLDNQQIIYLENTVSGKRVVKINPETGSRTVLLESASGFTVDDIHDGKLYFIREKGKVEALNLSNSELSQWNLPQPLASLYLEHKALPGGKLILIENRQGTGQISGGPCTPAPCPAASLPPSRYVYQFDTATGQAAAVSAFQNRDFFKEDFLVSPDGRHLAWASPSHFVVVDTATFSQQVLINDAEILGWLSNEQVLLKYRTRLEVYDITRKQTLSQVEGETLGYDSITRQALIVSGSNQSPAGTTFKTWSLSQPLNPGAPQAFTETPPSEILHPLQMPDSQGLLMVQNLHDEQKPMRLYRLKAQGAGLDKWLELPYLAQADFAFKPAESPPEGTRPWELMLLPF